MSASNETGRPALETSEPESGSGDLGALESFFDTDPTGVPSIAPGADRPAPEVVVADGDAEPTGTGAAPVGRSPLQAAIGSAESRRGRRGPTTRWRHEPGVLRRVVGAVVVVALAAVCVAVALRVAG